MKTEHIGIVLRKISYGWYDTFENRQSHTKPMRLNNQMDGLRLTGRMWPKLSRAV